MKEFTCKDCKLVNEIPCLPNGTVICSDFQTKDGKFPRFCRLASSIDEMAAALVHYFPMRTGRWAFYKGERISEFFFIKAEAVDAAKAWLMEVEE